MSGTTPRAGLSEGGLTDTDRCEHGVEYADECAVCDFEITEAQNAGAWTPKEIGLYWKGRSAGRDDLAAKVEALADEWEASDRIAVAVVAASRLRTILTADSTPREAPVPQRDGGVREALDVILARVRCELIHNQTNRGRCSNCISWARNVGTPAHLPRLLRAVESAPSPEGGGGR